MDPTSILMSKVSQAKAGIRTLDPALGCAVMPLNLAAVCLDALPYRARAG